jgi:hypothetical protein
MFNGDGTDVTQIVLSQRSLSDWETQHVREFLIQHGYHNVSEEHIELLRNCLKAKMSLRKILQTCQLWSDSDYERSVSFGS